jgi:hypothetical protein
MRLSAGLSLLVALVIAAPAHAVSVTNRDDKDYKLTVVEGDAKQDHVLKPNGVLDGVCLKGCVVRLGDSENDEYELEGTEVVSIEDGYLYFDGPEVGAEPAPGSNAQPPPAQAPAPPAPAK